MPIRPLRNTPSTRSADADTLRRYGAMGDPVDVGPDADPMTRFLGLTGRDPNR